MPANRSKIILSALVLSAGALAALAQTTAPATAPATTIMTITGEGLIHTGNGTLILTTSPATVPAGNPVATIQPPASAPATAAGEAAVLQPFVATINGDKVYIRSGPSSTTYYEIGQLVKGDTVYVVGASKDYYKILPPNGSYCLIAKEFVDVDAVPGGAGSAIVKADYVNVRAGTAIYKTRDTSILTVVRKGDKLKVIGGGGPADKYVEIAPPDHAYFYVAAQFITKAPDGTEYKVPDLKLPAGVTGPLATVTAPTTLPTATVQVETRPGPVVVTTHPAPDTTQVASTEPFPIPEPVQFSTTAAQKFSDLNARYTADMKKPADQRNPDDLITEYKALLAMDNISPSVKSGSEQMIADLEKAAVLKRLMQSAQVNDQAIAQERDAIRRQYEAAEKAMADYKATAPYDFSGVLQTSTIVQGKYALVNPGNGRVIAYIDPNSDIDVAIFIGKYIGVRGVISTPEGSDIKLVKVATATLMPAPK